MRLSFPWLMWHIWKMRNSFYFEHILPIATEAVRKAKKEASVWLNLNGLLQTINQVNSSATAVSEVWVKPPPTVLKCNIGSSWSASSSVSGAAWIIRNSGGRVLYHSRRAFSGVCSKLQASLTSISWAASAVRDLKLQNVIFEFSFVEASVAISSPLDTPSSYYMCYEVLSNVFSVLKSELRYVLDSGNQADMAIAGSVTRDQRLQSYMASGGPSWLSELLSAEAAR